MPWDIPKGNAEMREYHVHLNACTRHMTCSVDCPLGYIGQVQYSIAFVAVQPVLLATRACDQQTIAACCANADATFSEGDSAHTDG